MEDTNDGKEEERIFSGWLSGSYRIFDPRLVKLSKGKQMTRDASAGLGRVHGTGCSEPFGLEMVIGLYLNGCTIILRLALL